MALEYDDAPRFTPEQRDAILNLATRLQVEHEATISANDLARDAAEAGIDPRFVQEAATRLRRKSQPLPRSLGIALGLFVLQAMFFVFVQNPFMAGGRGLSAFELSFAIAMAFFLALWGARERRVRWLVPLVPGGVWAALFIATTLLTTINGVFQTWVLQDCVVFGLAQAVAALFGAIAAAGMDRLDGAPTLRREA